MNFKKAGKIAFVFFIFAFLPVTSFCENSFCAGLIENFFQLRMELSKIDDEKEDGTLQIISSIDNFIDSNKEVLNSLSPQEQLVMENFFVMEKYNYLYEKPEQKKNQQEILGRQLKKIETYVQKNSADNLHEYFLVTWGDVTSCYMGFSLSDVIKYGTTVRPRYEEALEKNPNLSYGLTNLGQWYYFAPKITGGSKKKSLQLFQKAKQNSVSPAENYFADIFLSQLLFENKEYGQCNELLEDAEKICDGSWYLKRIRDANDRGLSLFEYNRKKSSLNEEAEKK